MASCYTMERTGSVEESRRGDKRWIVPDGGRDMASCYAMERTGRAEVSGRCVKRWIVWK
ncbi:hypothetical protein ACFQ88_19800 [Paenibacillus sp. NPDC056579]|uniref:hypothetical protein n=1 Tax=Paenibacillus sp. NPDC056579 TaxID=3345871 RepID=UPI0036CC8C1D